MITRAKLEAGLNRYWYKTPHRWLIPFLVSIPYCFFMRVRYQLYAHVFARNPLSVPVIVVGNITVGGTGKTPLVIAIAKTLMALGFRPAIVTRGYKNALLAEPHLCREYDGAELIGDEARLLTLKTLCPVIIDAKRRRGAQFAIDTAHADIIICDDGLQHYALPRDIEIAVVDAQRQLGNGCCLPLGPLREPPSRLRKVDLIVSNGEPIWPGAHLMYYLPAPLYALNDCHRHKSLVECYSTTVHAVAGLANPDRFFETLTQHGMQVIPHPFPDHYVYQKSDLQFDDGHDIIMTEKDAVKCKDFAVANCWVLPVVATMDAAFWQVLTDKLNTCDINRRKQASQSLKP